MKKLFNFRLAVVLPSAFALGVLTFVAFAKSIILLWVFLLITPLLLCGGYCVAVKKNLYNALVIALVCEILLVCGFLLASARADKLKVASVSGEVIVSARFIGNGSNGYGKTYEFDSATFTVGERKFDNQKITVSGDGDVKFTYGDIVSFKCTVISSQIFNEEGVFDDYAYVTGVLFYGRTNFDVYQITDNKLNIFEKIAKPLKQTIKKNFGWQEGAIVTAMMFGDTSGLNWYIKDNVSYAGIAHVFAVSGLHVGFVSALIMLLLKLLRIKRKISAIIAVLGTFLYCGMCGFSPSTIRAFIMFCFYSVTTAYGLKYDLLSSIFISMGIILAIFPQDILSYGFLMSYSAVFSIAVFAKPVQRYLFFLPKSVSEGISATVSAQIGLLPVIMAVYNYTSWLAVVVNVLLIPLISVFFSLTVISVVLSTVTTLGFITFIPNFLAGLMVKFFASIDFKYFLVVGTANLYMIILYYVGMIVASDVINLPFKVKLPVFTLAVAVCIVFSQLFISGVL